MRVAALHIYPVKSMAGSSPGMACVESCGLAGDRRWMVVDQSGRFLSQRVHPAMAAMRAAPTATGLTLEMAGRPSLQVDQPGPDAPRVQVVVWRNALTAALAAPSASAWLSEALGQDVRLVHMHDPQARPIAPAYALAGETTSLADGYPVLLTSEGSLAELNARLVHPVPITRFRGNIVVEGAPAWAEDTWRRVRIGTATFRVAKPCDRCIVTTIDQMTGTRPDRMEPLRTLGKFRHDEHGIMFGQNLVPTTLGRVSVGDAVEVLESGEPNVVPIVDH